MTASLKPFWRYYGGKYRAAPRYPAPRYSTIVETCAGAAGYSLRYPDRRVVLLDRYDVIVEIWRYLIAASPAEILSVPLVESTDDLPASTPLGAKYLVGFCMNDASVSPSKTLSAGKKRLAQMGRHFEGWNEARRERVASQVGAIKHWRVFHIGFENAFAFNPEATWYVDPPYQVAGQHYKHSSIDYAHLAEYCRSRRGQVIACENEGADWLPFRPFGALKASPMRSSGETVSGVSREVIWTNTEAA